MPFAICPALFFTVAMLVTPACFLTDGLPLLTLSHDTPLDASLMRGFFRVYFRYSIATALGACVSCALWGRPAFEAGAGALRVMALRLGRTLLAAMQALDGRIQQADAGAIRGFRRVPPTSKAPAALGDLSKPGPAVRRARVHHPRRSRCRAT